MHRFLSFYMNALRGKGGKILCDPFSKFDLNLFATCVYDIITGVKKFCEMNFSTCFIDGEKNYSCFRWEKMPDVQDDFSKFLFFPL